LLIQDLYPRSWIPDLNFFHPECRILDPNFFHPGSLIPDPNFSVPDPGSRICIKLSILINKNGFSALRNMIWVFHAGSRSWIWVLTFYPSQILILDPRSRIQGSKRHWSPDPGSGFATLEILALLRL
jgi:hypothetical protein